MADYYADAVGELILSRVGVSFLWRRKALRPYGSSPILSRQQHRRSSYSSLAVFTIKNDQDSLSSQSFLISD